MGPEGVTRHAAGLVCAVARLGDLPAGALYVLGDDIGKVLAGWNQFGQTIHLRGRAAVPAAGQDLRVVVIRVVQRAAFKPAPEGA